MQEIHDFLTILTSVAIPPRRTRTAASNLITSPSVFTFTRLFTVKAVVLRRAFCKEAKRKQMDSELVTKHLQCCKWINKKILHIFELRTKMIITDSQNELTTWPAPTGLDSSVGRALYLYRRGHGFEFHSSLNWIQCSSWLSGAETVLEQFHTNNATLQKSLSLALIG